jgi:hypothetical protein
MQDQHSEAITPSVPSAAPGGRYDAHAIQSALPGQPGIASQPARAARRKSGNFLVTAILFVFIVGGLAWLVQYLPNWRKKPATPLALDQQLVFAELRAKWDPDDPEYAMEFERGQPGHYDFAFQNPTGETIELGLFKTSCDCSNVQAALLSDQEWTIWKDLEKKRSPTVPLDDSATNKFRWQSLTASDKSGMRVPGNSRGLVRVSWMSRKGEGQQLRLAVDLWTEPQGQPRQRRPVRLETSSVVVGPVLFTRPTLPVAALAPEATAQQQVFFWSATRSKLNFAIANKNPLIVWKAVPLGPDECRLLQRAVRGKDKKNEKAVDQRQLHKFSIPEGMEYNTRVRSAFRVTVTVYQKKGDKQLDQGPFQEMLPLHVDGQMVAGTPAVLGRVQGEVEIPVANDQGKIDLGNFPGKAGVKKNVILWTERGTTLSLAKHHPGLYVKLTENTKESTSSKRHWELKIEIFPGSQTGPLPDDSAIILRIPETQSTPSRQIRIPVLGTAVQR